MALLKAPDCGVAVTVTFPDPPDWIVMDDGFVPNDTVGLLLAVPPQLDVNFTAPDIWLLMLGFPIACTYNV